MARHHDRATLLLGLGATIRWWRWTHGSTGFDLTFQDMVMLAIPTSRFNEVVSRMEAVAVHVVPLWMSRRIGRALVADGRFAEADIALRRGLARHPRDGDLLVTYGLSATYAGHHAEASRRWADARKQRPDLVMAWCGLSASARLLGDFDKARIVMAGALDLFPGDLVIACEAAREAYARGAHDEAVALWKRVCDVPAPLSDHFQGLIECLIAAERNEEAEGWIDQATALHPDDPGLRALRAILAIRRQDFDAAAEILREYRSRYRDDETGVRLIDELARLRIEALERKRVVDEVKAAELDQALRRQQELEQELAEASARLALQEVIVGKARAEERERAAGLVGDPNFRVPLDLTRSTNWPDRILVLGACFSEQFANWLNIQGRTQADFYIINHFSVPNASPPRPVEDYAFQVVQVPLRSILPEKFYMRLSYDRPQDYEDLFSKTVDYIRLFLDSAMTYNIKYNILTFVTNFSTPIQNPMGRIIPRYDLRNFSYFMENINRALADIISEYKNVYILDVDGICSTIGRRYVQDEVLQVSSHNAILSDFDFSLDQNRISSPIKPSYLYPMKSDTFLAALWQEALATYRIVTQADVVKLVILDLDDTLWRGLPVETDNALGFHTVEGWPLGVVEALQYLKKRGILLAIASKNDEAKVAGIWDEIWEGRLLLEDFAVRKINWKTKTENIADILKAVNLLPRNVLFIDDNPVERGSVQAAFPDMRVLGQNHYVIRRVLLWSSETQVATITDESSRRTEMIQSQVKRETARSTVSREAFIASLGIEIKAYELTDPDHPKFARAFELLNKTNQFNTNGRRWSLQECVAHFAAGHDILAFEVKDIYTNYGLVIVVIMAGDEIVQYVMSCRVVGLDVETRVLETIVARVGAPWGTIVPTSANAPIRDLYARHGFVELGDGQWVSAASASAAAPAGQIPAYQS